MDKWEIRCELTEFNEYSLANPRFFDWDKSFVKRGEAVILLKPSRLGEMSPKQKIRYEGFLRMALDRAKTAYTEEVTVYYGVSLDGVEPFYMGLYGLKSNRRLNGFLCEEAEDERYWKVWKTLSAYGLRLLFR